VTTAIGQLEIQEHSQDGVPVLSVEGEVDLASAPDLCACLAAHRGERFVVDLTQVAFCDSCGLRALLGEAHESRIMGGRSVVVIPSRGQVRNLIDMTGLATMIEVTGDLDAAVARLHR
jgi:anti-anti-sigma factor